MTYDIVPFSPEHEDRILALSLAAWAPVFDELEPAVPAFVYGAFYPEGWRHRQVADVQHFLRIEGERAWVAVAGQEVLGWVGIRVHQEDGMGEIFILAVDPARQRQGLATALIEHAFSVMRKFGLAIAMVETGDDPGHAPSRSTYEHVGFQRWPVARYFRQL